MQHFAVLAAGSLQYKVTTLNSF